MAGNAPPNSPAPNSLAHGGAADRFGAPLRRFEDERLVTGQGRFTDDIPLEGALRVAFVRSPVAHGELMELEMEAARAMPGVAAVFSGADVADLGSLSVNPILPDLRCPPFPVLACGRVRAVGQPVAAVLADTAAQAADAAEYVGLDVEPETAKVDIGDHAPDLFADIPGDEVLSGRWIIGTPHEAFKAAATVVSARVRHARVAPTSMEPRTIAARHDPQSDRLTVWMSTQTPHRARNELARILHRDPSSIRVVAPDVGGAFGMKGSLFPEEAFVAWAAIRLGRPVRWTATRSEEFLSATQGRGAVNEGRLALDADGRFLALEARIAYPLGHWLPFSAAVPAWNVARILPGPYAVPDIDIATRAELTTTAALGIYRGAGRPEAAALMERLVDEAAAALDLDPAEIRRRNMIAPETLPASGPVSRWLDSGDYPTALTRLQDIAGYDALLAERSLRRAKGEVVGLGLAFYIEPSGQGWETAEVRHEPDGRIIGTTGSSAQGQGRETAFAQILAEVFDVPAASVTIRHGDTDAIAEGIGALASRSTPIGGSALYQAACEVRDRLRQEQRTGEAIVANVKYTAEGEAWGYGCHLAVVAIDPETGTPALERLVCLDDAGRILNPLLAEGQIRGGIAQGIGEALLEAVHYDRDGQLLTGSFMDYAMPRADTIPPITIEKMQTPAPGNLIGAKGIGEAGTIGAPAAILNAVADALRPLGAPVPDMPLTAEKLWRAMKGAAPTGETR